MNMVRCWSPELSTLAKWSPKKSRKIWGFSAEKARFSRVLSKKSGSRESENSVFLHNLGFFDWTPLDFLGIFGEIILRGSRALETKIWPYSSLIFMFFCIFDPQKSWKSKVLQNPSKPLPLGPCPDDRAQNSVQDSINESSVRPNPTLVFAKILFQVCHFWCPVPPPTNIWPLKSTPVETPSKPCPLGPCPDDRAHKII